MTLQNSITPVLRDEYYTSCMHGLDDVGWDHGFSFSGYGAAIGVRSNCEGLLDQLLNCIPYACTPSDIRIVDRLFSILVVAKTGAKEERYNFYWDHLLFGRDLLLSDMLDRFEASSSLAIAELSKDKLFVHAGVVEWQGKAIVIPGKSFSGKTTLVAELVKSGATYYSDEFTVIDNKGYVSPYPKPLSMRSPGELKQKSVPVEEIQGRMGKARVPIGLVVIGHFQNDAIWEPHTMPPGNGLLALLENTHAAQRTPDRAIHILKKVAEGARFIQGIRGEANAVAPKILGYASA